MYMKNIISTCWGNKMIVDIKVMVATHKVYWMPDDDVYLPIQLGKSIHQQLSYIGDNTGDNISKKQPYYSELTAVYWAWKNLAADYIGINHYRRYFSKEKLHFFGEADKEKLFGYADFAKLLKKAPVILPKERNYYISSRQEQYSNSHNIRDLDICRNVLAELYPDYLKTFDASMAKTHGHILNMFVMRKDIFYSYCEWLFDILFEVERRVDLSGYDEYQQRVFGYLAERLLDVWIKKNDIDYVEANYVVLEKVDWVNKVYKFLSKKF